MLFSIISIKLQYSILIFPRVLTTKTQGSQGKKTKKKEKNTEKTRNSKTLKNEG